jgi:hypothetical protein
LLLITEIERRAVVVILTDQRVVVDGLVAGEDVGEGRAVVPEEAEAGVDLTAVENATLSVTAAVTERKGYIC